VNSSLALARCENVTDQGLIAVANLLNKRYVFKDVNLNFLKYYWRSLHALELFSCYQITDEVFTCLAEGLKKQKELECLSLVFE